MIPVVVFSNTDRHGVPNNMMHVITVHTKHEEMINFFYLICEEEQIVSWEGRLLDGLGVTSFRYPGVLPCIEILDGVYLTDTMPDATVVEGFTAAIERWKNTGETE